MQQKTKQLRIIPDVNKYSGRDRTLAVTINKYLNNNKTLLLIWEKPIEYDKKIFEFKTSVKKKISHLKECIENQEYIFQKIWKQVQKDIASHIKHSTREWVMKRRFTLKAKEKLIRQYWEIPEDIKYQNSVRKNNWYVSPNLTKAYQYLRPFPDGLLRRWYSTEYSKTEDGVVHKPERQPQFKYKWYEAELNSITYLIREIRRIENSFVKERNALQRRFKSNLLLEAKWKDIIIRKVWREQMMMREEARQYARDNWLFNDYEELIRIGKEETQKEIETRTEEIKKILKDLKEKLYNIINNPSDPKRKDIEDYDPSQHWRINTIIWPIYY